MSKRCINCNSARLVEIGYRVGSLWCFLKRGVVPALGACAYFVDLNEQKKAVGSVARSLVKSATKCQNGTEFVSSSCPLDPLVKSATKSQIETFSGGCDAS